MQTVEVKCTNHKIEIDHLKKSSTKSYDAVLTSFENLLGKPSLEAITDAIQSKEPDAVHSLAGKSQFMILAILDMGTMLPTLRSSGRRAKQYLIGNPLFADQMVKHNIEAGLYAPLRVFLFEEAKGSTFVFDRPSSLFGQWHLAEIDKVAKNLDQLLDDLIDSALG